MKISRNSQLNLKNLLLIFLIFIFENIIHAQNINLPYHNPTPGEISIMACSPIPSDIEPSKQAFQDVVNCGFNLLTSTGSVAYFRKLFDLIEDLPLNCIISNPNFIKEEYRRQYLSVFKDNKHLGGWLLKDEPAFDTWSDLSPQYKAFSVEDPNHIVLIDLVGMLMTKFTGNTRSIPDYLQTFQDMFTPSVWSYDYYPILIQNGKFKVEYDQFYSNLEAFSAMSKTTQRPFWAFCESMEYSTKSYSRPAATEAYLNFEAFSALAYGAQGIAYWTYALRNSNEAETYISALVDMKGKKSPAWYAAQNVNNNIKKFNEVFYECDVKEVRHTGDKLYKDTKRLSGEIGPFKMIKGQEAGVLVSRIENKGKKFIVIVNHDVQNKQKLLLELSPNKKVKDLTSKNGKIYNWRKDISVTLNKGGYLIFQEIDE